MCMIFDKGTHFCVKIATICNLIIIFATKIYQIVKNMAAIYISFSSHIAKVLRQSLGSDGNPIDIPATIRCDSYWHHIFPFADRKQLRLHPSLLELFTKALRTGQEQRAYIPYNLAYSENEYNNFPDSSEKRSELVSFLLPRTLDYGVLTSANTVMEQGGGARFRQAAIYYAYDCFSAFLHANNYDCIREHRPFSVSEAIRLFADHYGMTSNEQDVLRQQYYRRKLYHQ